MIVNGNDKLILNAQENIYINELTLDGTYAIRNNKRENAKVLFDAKNVIVKNVNVNGTIYNALEQPGSSVMYPVENFKASNINATDTNIKHNIINIYKFADNATVEISDSTFDLNVVNSNIMRVSNIGDAKNVTITFKNIDWTYETAGYTEEDKQYAGLILFQPWPSDADSAYKSKDLTSIKTWKFIFDNCKYNGQKITENIFGSISQAIYGYTLDAEGNNTCNINGILNIEFK